MAVLPVSIEISTCNISANFFSCPPVCIEEAANSGLSSKHRAPMLHFNWLLQPHVSLPLQIPLHGQPFYLPNFAMKAAGYCDQAFWRMNKTRTQSNRTARTTLEASHIHQYSSRMAGIAVFPTPGKSPSMPSMPSMSLAVERIDPVFMHTHIRGVLHRLLYNCTKYTTAPLQKAESAPNPRFPIPNLPQSTHINKHILSLDRHIIIAYTTRARHSQAIS